MNNEFILNLKKTGICSHMCLVVSVLHRSMEPVNQTEPFIQKIRKISDASQEYILFHSKVEDYQHKLSRFIQDLKPDDEPMDSSSYSNYSNYSMAAPGAPLQSACPLVTPQVHVVDENDPESMRGSEHANKQSYGKRSSRAKPAGSASVAPLPQESIVPLSHESVFPPLPPPETTSGFVTEKPAASAAPIHLRAKEPVGAILGDIWDSINTQPSPFYVAQVSMEKFHVISRILVANDSNINRTSRMRSHNKIDLMNLVVEHATMVQTKRIAYMLDMQKLVDEVTRHFYATSVTSASGAASSDPAGSMSVLPASTIPTNTIHNTTDYQVFSTQYPEYGIENIDLTKYTLEQIAFVRTRMLVESAVLDLYVDRLHDELNLFKEIKDGKVQFNTKRGTVIG
jgi:hypothetical protein